ncbi:glucose-6-phosphate isomerase [Candidatus Palauibacter sp.]|uniref:glucose-6-phosphate isomerase n=1 Tax=Candidatus Palauibacter sp. TaxID=3101350 RepID=UPI003B01B806
MIEIEFSLGSHREDVERRLQEWASQDAVARLWRGDPTLWSADPETPELADRLGWLDLPETSRAGLEALEESRTSVPFWFTDLVLIGMGGSSLAPEVIARTMPGEGLPLTLVDTTHPGAIRDLDWLRPANSLFVVASKSGTTIETLSLFRHFWSRTSEVVDEPGAHFIAITDPGSPLAELGRERAFRAVFEASPDAGGRFSALGPFGLAPAALAGADVAALLGEAVEAAAACQDEVQHNAGFRLGAALGELALAGRDKVTFLAGPDWEAFPDWAEQLIAESTGKDGRGIVPVVAEPPRPADEYGDDRVFVGLILSGDAAREAEQWGEADETSEFLDAGEAAGHPVIRIRLERPEELGALFYVWEVGVAMAGSVLGIHPFNQPDVQLAKHLARRAMAGASRPEGAPDADDAQPSEAEEIDLVWELPQFGHAPPRAPVPPDVDGIRARVKEFLSSVDATDYIAVQAYLAGGEEEETLLAALRTALAEATGATTTLGHGPRFLHSTGQLHKGGADNGAFLQLVDDAGEHVHVPGAEFTFRQLIRAQALGDLEALGQRERRTLRVRVGGPEGLGLRRLIQLVEEYA